MKLHKGAAALWFFTLLLLLVGVAGILAAVIGDSWWDKGNDSRDGLWKECINGECKDRDNALKFHEDFRDKDAILLVLIVSTVVSVFATVNLLCLLCCRNDEDNWKCGSLILTLFSFSGAIAGLGAFIYSEVQFKDEWNKYDHGWAVIFGWIGACCLAIAFVLSFALICNGPEADDYNKELVNRSAYNGHNGHNNARNNRGYELQ